MICGSLDESFESEGLLKEVKRMLDEELFIVENIDATIIAQKPKMAPYLQEMRTNIAEVLQIAGDHLHNSHTGHCAHVLRADPGSQDNVLPRRPVHSEPCYSCCDIRRDTAL